MCPHMQEKICVSGLALLFVVLGREAIAIRLEAIATREVTVRH